MKHALGGLTLLLAVGLLTGCSTMGRQPQLTDALMTPNTLKPGDTAVITVKVKDRNDIVRKVEGIVREDASIKLKLRDDGVSPDEKAGDSVWTLQVDVPFQAPPGQFTLDLTAYRGDGSPVPVHGPEGKTVPLSVSVPITISGTEAKTP